MPVDQGLALDGCGHAFHGSDLDVRSDRVDDAAREDAPRFAARLRNQDEEVVFDDLEGLYGQHLFESCQAQPCVAILDVVVPPERLDLVPIDLLESNEFGEFDGEAFAGCAREDDELPAVAAGAARPGLALAQDVASELHLCSRGESGSIQDHRGMTVAHDRDARIDAAVLEHVREGLDDDFFAVGDVVNDKPEGGLAHLEKCDVDRVVGRFRICVRRLVLVLRRSVQDALEVDEGEQLSAKTEHARALHGFHASLFVSLPDANEFDQVDLGDRIALIPNPHDDGGNDGERQWQPDSNRGPAARFTLEIDLSRELGDVRLDGRPCRRRAPTRR